MWFFQMETGKFQDAISLKTNIQERHHFDYQLINDNQRRQNMNLFEEIRDKISTFELAQYYGLHPNQNGKNAKCLCCFHPDSNPSMVIYPNAFHCFACGAHVDVTGLVAKLFNLSNYEAAKKIAADFHLNINDCGRISVNKSKYSSNTQDRSFSEGDIAYGLKLWHNATFVKYCEKYKVIRRRLENWKCPDDIKPEDEELYATLVSIQGELDWITDILIYGNEKDVLELYKNLKNMEALNNG